MLVVDENDQLEPHWPWSSISGLIEVNVDADLLDANLVSEHGSVLSLDVVGELVVAEGVGGVAVGVGLLNVLVENAEVSQVGAELLNGRHVLSTDGPRFASCENIYLAP